MPWWRRKVYGWQYDLKSGFTDDCHSSVITRYNIPEFLDAVELQPDLYERSRRITQWLAATTRLTGWPQPVPTRENWEGWRIKVKPFDNGFEVVALTEANEAYFQKLLIKAQKTEHGVELMLFQRDESNERDGLEQELGLVHFAILYFSREKWEIMPPPPVPSKWQ